MDIESSNEVAEAFYDGIIVLGGVVWCASTMRDWERVAPTLEKVAQAAEIGTPHGPGVDLQSAKEALSKVRALVQQQPSTPEQWRDLEIEARECLRLFGFSEDEYLPARPERTEG